MNRIRPAPVIAIGLFLIATLLYSGSLHNEFVWDDRVVVNQHLPYFKSLTDAFSPPRETPQFGAQYYRPLVTLTYMLDERIAGVVGGDGRPDISRRVVFHLSGILLHAAATVLVFLLAQILLRLALKSPRPYRNLTAAAAGLLFAVHPIHVESVAWMVGRSDVLCAVFLLASTASYIKYRETGRLLFWGLASITALAAMLSKETGIALVLLIPAIDLFLQRPIDRAGSASRRIPGWARWAPFAAGAGLSILLRYHGTRGFPAVTSDVAAGAPGLGKLPGALGWYTVKLFWPPPQSAFIPAVPGGVLAALGGLSAVLAVVGLVRIGKRPGWGPERIAAALLLAGFLPSLATTIFRVSETPLAERYLYIPSAGFSLLLAFLLARAMALPAETHVGLRRSIPAAIACLLVLAWTATALGRTRVWESNLRFWEDTARKAPGSGIPHLHLGNAYTDAGRLDEAVEQYRIALKTYRTVEGRSRVHSNLANTLIRMGRYAEAIEECRASLAEDPRSFSPHYNWGVAGLSLSRASTDPLERTRWLREGLEQLERSLALNPRFTKAHLRLGAELIAINRVDEGRTHLQEVLRLAPGSEDASDARRLLARLTEPGSQR